MALLSWQPHCTNWRPRGQTDTDASDIGTGAVLSQVQDGEERVISYASKSLGGTKQWYFTARMELLEVVQALKHFKCYLYGQKITVRTDNSAVSWLYRSKDHVGQPARWIEVIDTYNVTFQHRPGRKHGNADALSTTGSDMADRGSNPKEKISCPKCGNRVQRDGMRWQDRNMHQGQRKRIHVCLYCSRVNPKTYSTFNDWKKHLIDTCLRKCEPLMEAEYAAGFKLDRWQRLHKLEGNEADPLYVRIANCRRKLGRMQGGPRDEPPIRLHHTKGETPDKDLRPTELEQAESERGNTDLEQSREGLEEDKVQDQEAFTGI